MRRHCNNHLLIAVNNLNRNIEHAGLVAERDDEPQELLRLRALLLVDLDANRRDGQSLVILPEVQITDVANARALPYLTVDRRVHLLDVLRRELHQDR